MIKYIVVILCFGPGLCLMAQPGKKELKQHRQLVEASKLASSGLISLDTFFCAGEPVAVVEGMRDSLTGIVEQRINKIGNGQTMIILSHLSYGNQQMVVPYIHFSFPGLGMSCDVERADAYETMCKYNLFRKQSLDTGSVEIFVVLKGHLDVAKAAGIKTLKDSMMLDKSIIVSRNKKAMLLFTEENIVQDQQVIGSFKESTTTGIHGPVKQLSIYNSIGALICTVTETSPTSHDWRLLTYKDHKFHSLKSTGNDREDIVKYLVEQGFL